MAERRPPPRKPSPPRSGGPPRKKADGPRGDGPEPERLQKVLAHAGIASRRACEELILQGRVTVDGQVARELGTRVDPSKQKIAVDGQSIRPERLVYFAVSKPKGYVSTNSDPSGRPLVVDLLPEIPERVFTVGRLDEASVGLMILTNDGELANKLAHPRFGVEKLYRCVVAGQPTPEVLDKLIEGVWLADGKARARRVKIVGKQGDAAVLEMVLAEGKNREVRRMLAKLGHKVMSLTRVAVGPITLRGLRPGEWRPLSPPEIEDLRRAAAGLPTRRGPSSRSASSDRPARPPSRGPGRYAAEEGRRPATSGGPSGGPMGGVPRPSGGPPKRASRPSGGPVSGPSSGPPKRASRPPGGPAPVSERRTDRPAGPRPSGPGELGEPRGRKILGLPSSMREDAPARSRRPGGGPPKRAGGPGGRAGGPSSGPPRKAPMLKRPRRRPAGEGGPPPSEGG